MEIIIRKGDENIKFGLFNRVSLILIILLLALNIILLLPSSRAPSYAAKSIQYKVIRGEKVSGKKENFEKLFNEYGKEGWEFITFDLQWGFYIFKR